jgi:copper homeostasis protein
VTPRITLEVAVTSTDEATRAVKAGADRLELCSALAVGGVTPSPGTFQTIRDALPQTPIYVLLRPRPGGFHYSASEFVTLLRDAEWFLSHGAAGLVCGFVDDDARVIRACCVEVAALAKGKAVFHRAFDFLTAQFASLEALIDIGFERVLTSGGAFAAEQGKTAIAELVRRAQGRIQILPGGGISSENVAELIRATGCTQVHGSFRSRLVDQSLIANPALAAMMGQAKTTDAEQVRQVRAALDEFAAHQ